MIQNKVAGATELEKMMRNWINNCRDKEKIIQRCKKFLYTYPSMGSLWRTANKVFLQEENSDIGGNDFEQQIKNIMMYAVKLIQPNMTILTYSRSSLVSQVLKSCADKKIKVFCSESRPNYEGRILAKELSEAEIETEFMVDSAIFSCVCHANMLILGADAFVKNGIVNKVGTLALINFAYKYKLPIYIISTSSKAFPFVFMKEESDIEIWENASEYIKIKNCYFDITPYDFITAFVTENGISSSPPIYKEQITDEIIAIKKSMSSTFMLIE